MASNSIPELLRPFLSAEFVLFALFALGAVSTAVVMVLQPNPVRSALFLVLNLFSVAVLYLLLNAWFLAVVQIIVYAGAIMVLFLFVIMLLNLGTPDRTVDRLRWQQPVAVVAGLVLAGIFGWMLATSTPQPAQPVARRDIATRNALGTVGGILEDTDGDKIAELYNGIGQNLFDPKQPWLFPFEVTSILLLIAVIGAVILAKRPAQPDVRGEP